MLRRDTRGHVLTWEGKVQSPCSLQRLECCIWKRECSEATSGSRCHISCGSSMIQKKLIRPSFVAYSLHSPVVKRVYHSFLICKMGTTPNPHTNFCKIRGKTENRQVASRCLFCFVFLDIVMN